MQLAQKKNIVVTEDRLYIPPTLADPVEFEAVRKPGEFNETVIEGTITVYLPRFEADALPTLTYYFRLGRLHE